MVCDDLGLCALASFLKEQCILSILSKPSASKYDTISLNSHINKIESIDPLHSLYIYITYYLIAASSLLKVLERQKVNDRPAKFILHLLIT